MRNVTLRKDRLKRFFFKKYESKRNFYKVIQQNFNIDRKIRIHYTEKISSSFLKESALSMVRNRCILTARGRSIYRDFRLSRMQLRHFASFGYLMGVKKSSW